MDPWQVIAILAGTVSTLAGLLYRHILRELADERAEKLYWRERALSGTGLAEIATEQAEAPRRKR